eukprot:CAMPEP_0114516014 /NCGR_PEP_ID=MMETSP0109-20121206/17088_1 /TAXON_ID=29199 /ORGANISM="Chlorarachnion reptans, Strain CCCM449" /LENGTH=258 /DNA_ID=CAMNT_0001696347 /DNA_START=20 /DNA_END=792 /DNA_ORIENTATION=-
MSSENANSGRLFSPLPGIFSCVQFSHPGRRGAVFKCSVVDRKTEHLRVRVGCLVETRVVDFERVVAGVASQEDPVGAAADVGYDPVARGEASLQGGDGHARLLALVRHPKGRVDRRPHEEVGLGVAAVGVEPLVELGRVNGMAPRGQVHRQGGHRAAGPADRVARARSEGLISPAAVALLVRSPGARACVRVQLLPARNDGPCGPVRLFWRLGERLRGRQARLDLLGRVSLEGGASQRVREWEEEEEEEGRHLRLRHR